MELMYRGARYQVAPAPVQIVDTPEVGQYRGSAVKFHQLAVMPTVQRILHLVYRGVAFDEDISTLTPEG